MFVDIKVGYACNDRCIHCVMEPVRRELRGHGKRSDATTDEALAMISAAKTQGAQGVVLTGGEVTIRKDFHALVARARTLSLDVTIQTNGRQLGTPGFLSFLDEDPCIGFVIALHGPNEGVHDRITQVLGSFAETVAGIRAAVAQPGTPITGKIVLSRHNLIYLPETVVLFADLGVCDICVAFPHVDGFIGSEICGIAPKYTETAPVVRETLAAASARNMQVIFETIPYCVVPNVSRFWIHSQDARYAAEGANQGASIDAYALDHIEDWSAQRRSIKRKFKSCQRCVYDLVCEGPWMEYVEVYGDAEFIPITELDETGSDA